MSRDVTHNGYHNYETWLVKVCIDNDQENIEFWLVQARYLYINHAEDMKEYYEERMPESISSDNIGGLWADLLHSALSDVVWIELSGMIMETALENLELTS